jgi:hypothetical protein
MCERYWPLYITVISVILWFYVYIYIYVFCSFNFSRDARNTPNQEMTSGLAADICHSCRRKGTAAAIY